LKYALSFYVYSHSECNYHFDNYNNGLFINLVMVDYYLLAFVIR